MEIFRDYCYTYMYDIKTNTINTELRITMENRSKLTKVKKIPCIDRNLFIQKAQEKGIKIPDDFKISWSELFRNCENLININIFNKCDVLNRLSTDTITKKYC